MRESEKRLIKAVSSIIEKDGFAKVGINRISREAGCDKVLIYRYFGGLEGLLNTWAKENDFYTIAYDTFCSRIENANKDELKKLAKEVLTTQLHFLRKNVMMQELILWELTGKSKFKTLQDIREKNGLKLQETFNKIFGLKNEDVNIYITILITAIEYIVLYTNQYSHFNGLNFTSEKSWQLLETALNNYIDMLFITLDI